MLIRVVESGAQPPSSENPGTELWLGGYGDPTIEEGSAFPASILTVVLDNFEIGSWYAVEEFRNILASAKTEEFPSWTVLNVLEKDIVGRGHFDMQVSQAYAALTICDAVLTHVARRKTIAGIWLRIE